MLFIHREIHNTAVRAADRVFPFTLSSEASRMPDHAWGLSVIYIKQKTENGHFWARITPGMVNGLPAAIKMEYKNAPLDAVTRIKEKLAKQGKTKLRDTDMVDVYLDESASLKLMWRRIGLGAAPTNTDYDKDGKLVSIYEKIPDFFKRLGVNDAQSNMRPENTNFRYLAACDLVLNQPRPIISTELTAEAGIVGTFVTASPDYIVPIDVQPRVVAMPKFKAPTEEPISPRDALYRQFTDPPADLAHLSTVYALSPLNPSTEEINESWQIFVKYNIHWNLAHASRVQTFKPPSRITLFTGLVAGLGDFLFNYILSNNNDWAAALSNLMMSSRAYGKFYAV